MNAAGIRSLAISSRSLPAAPPVLQPLELQHQLGRLAPSAADHHRLVRCPLLWREVVVPVVGYSLEDLGFAHTAIALRAGGRHEDAILFQHLDDRLVRRDRKPLPRASEDDIECRIAACLGGLFRKQSWAGLEALNMRCWTAARLTLRLNRRDQDFRTAAVDRGVFRGVLDRALQVEEAELVLGADHDIAIELGEPIEERHGGTPAPTIEKVPVRATLGEREGH